MTASNEVVVYLRQQKRAPDNRLAAQGVVALAASMLDGNESRKQILHCIEQLDDSATVSYVRDEIAWRAEY